MKRIPLFFALVLLAFLVTPVVASADRAPRAFEARSVRSGRLYFAGARSHAGDAPREDQDRVAGTVDSSLRQAHHRVRRCLADNRVFLGGRHFGERIRGSVTFNRSERPSGLRLVSGTLPPAAERCVREVAQTLYVRPAPRGSVEVRFSYRVR